MPRPLSALLLPLLLLPAIPAQRGPMADPEEALMRTIPVSRWADPTSRPETREEWLRTLRGKSWLVDAPLQATRTYRSPAPIWATGRRLDILVNAALLPALQASLDVYLADIETAGWAATVYACTGGTPTELREMLALSHSRHGIAGCLLVGDLPVAWYRNENDFNNRPAEFPTDLYYMDLDGVFEDTNKDGKFDKHTGRVSGDEKPDIFVGRLTASPLATLGMEIDLLKNYFRKVHDYRIGKLKAPERALAFQDDDWYTMGTAQEYAYATVVKVTDKATTTANEYKRHLGLAYESVVVCSHSSPTVHTFKVPGSTTTRIYNTEMWKLNPPCLFYNLFACSNARYTSSKYYGGVYLFAPTSGLIALGTTKTGSMLSFHDYYRPLGGGETFGESFRSWFERRWPYSNSDICWFYGMTLLGDPTLRIDRAGLTAAPAIVPRAGGKVALTLDGRRDSRGRAYLLLASTSGTLPGVSLPGVRLPLVHDPAMEVLVLLATTPAFAGGVGTLGADGRAGATLNLGVLPAAVWGSPLYLSGLVLDPVGPTPGLCTPPIELKLGAP